MIPGGRCVQSGRPASSRSPASSRGRCVLCRLAASSSRLAIGVINEGCVVMRGIPTPTYNTGSSSQCFVPKLYIMSQFAALPSSGKLLMSSRHRRRCLLADRIAARGVLMSVRCASCERRNIACRVDLSSGRCAECTRSGHGCSLSRPVLLRTTFLPFAFLC